MVVYADWCGYSGQFIKGHYATFEANHQNDSLGLVKVEVSNKPLFSAAEKLLYANNIKVEGFPSIYYNTPQNKIATNTIGRTPDKLETFVRQHSIL